MTTPAPDDAGILGKLLAGAGAALAALGTWAWRHTHSRIDRVDTAKADKDAFDKLAAKVENHTISKDAFEQHVKSDERQLSDLNIQIGTQRSHIAKIFDQMRDMENAAHARHVELLNAVHDKHK